MADPKSSGVTLLVVDDEPQLLRLMRRILEAEGHRIIPAQDGDEAIALFTRHRDEIDVVILDVIIPPAGAGQVVKALREQQPDFRLLLSSGDQLDAALTEALEALSGTFLRKPYVPQALLDAVAQLAATRSPAGESFVS